MLSHGERPAGSVGDLLALLRDGRPHTRTELAQETGLARNTVSQKLDVLLATGLVVETKRPTATGGRPSAAYELDKDSRCVLVAELGARHGTFVATDLLGNVLEEITDEDLRIDAGPDHVLKKVAEHLLAIHGRLDGRPAVGIGVGLPGPVEHATGRPKSPPIMPGWDGHDIVGRLSPQFGVPVVVDNDANLLARGERLLAWPDVDDLMYVKVATGVGAGLIMGGRLARGAQGAAGDLGHVYTDLAADRLCRCGNVGCLEAMAGGLAIATQLTARGIPADGAVDVARLARSGNLEAIRAIRDAGRAIGSVLATCISLLNPQVIVVGGELAMIGEALISGVRETVYQRISPLAAQYLHVTQAKGGRLGGAIGAAHMVLDSVLDPLAFDSRLASGA